MDPRLNVWPDDEEPSETAKLIREIDREIAADLRAAGEPSVWDEIAKVFDEEALMSPREEVVERKRPSRFATSKGGDGARPRTIALRGCAPTSTRLAAGEE